MMSAFAELEANLLSERTKKELDVARARGRKMDDLHYLTIRREKLILNKQELAVLRFIE